MLILSERPSSALDLRVKANACGTPVIASDVPGLRDSVKHAGAGYLVSYGDVGGFATHILKIIKNKDLCADMSVEARAWAENFDWEKSGQKFLAILEAS